MWFDPHAKLAEIAGHPPATSATPATNTPDPRPVSQKSQVSQPPAPEISPEELARDLYEERAAIREYEGGQDRADAEYATKVEADKAAGETQTAFAALHQAELASVSSSSPPPDPPNFSFVRDRDWHHRRKKLVRRSASGEK